MLARKYHTDIKIFLSYDELEQFSLNDAEKAPLIDFNSLQKIRERILNFMHDQSGSADIESLGYILLMMIAGLVLCKVVKQVQTNTFAITFGKIIGFLLATSVLIYHYWRKRDPKA